MRASKRSSLIHLIYFSRSQLSAEPPVRARQIAEIARHAQKKNEFSVITSLLIVDQGYFIQILEGERLSVQETFQRISTDVRHRDVHIVEWREITKREFVTSFATALRAPSNEALFQRANLGPMLQRGTPKASTVYGLAQALQAEVMAKQGIDHLFV
ncbi:BLUF domain-containing protein [Methylobacterium nonmethylotrophicum]|uniref:BLUF domain-containing protein n=1 Tax=Methylobacterium nonmethylotrophicum TaxID=1141884 RepID=A0A4Z0NTG2_9HYPH|nr:BLUF domain-containing protein [Methylobacterium nonmethylotrophicum]TGE00037.1 BLUF domain-containing protein [Methylobacterium nonmethylotrophicum]